ncbi:carbohydrate ABC transporter permease [Inconstantimicrobium mannanitabidum]|uniref:Sugar ABC transporter permease n=1 Tax=Inconstantimicrobium mannanitabidum TaxID=1604901 RepID=A0ACB5R7R1_9CLOT|nr:sugar ABC transporter permease [Clostridium sp. TW13]GKX65053.1 sugar ABC transporter permease [Clostridium sp. TW13]
MKLRNKEAMAGYFFIAPSIIGYLIFFGVPFIISLYFCFTKGIGDVEYVGFQNFIDLLSSETFQLAAKNTLYFNVVSVPLNLCISLVMAVVLNSKLKGISYFRTIFVMPLVIPSASVVLVWQIFFHSSGVLNDFLSIFGYKSTDWLNSPWAFNILVLFYIWKNCGYNIIIFLAGLNSISQHYYEAAYIDGCGKFKSFCKITIPMLMPTTFFVFVFSIINSFKVYREAFMLGGNYPHSSIYMLQHFMNNNFYNLNYQRLSTAAFLVFIFIALLVYILLKFEKRYGEDC